jgi:hypothetical protein
MSASRASDAARRIANSLAASIGTAGSVHGSPPARAAARPGDKPHRMRALRFFAGGGQVRHGAVEQYLPAGGPPDERSSPDEHQRVTRRLLRRVKPAARVSAADGVHLLTLAGTGHRCSSPARAGLGEHNGNVEIAEHLDALCRQGELMAGAADRAGLAAVVLPCPSWQVRDLLRHTGYIHRWAARHITECPREVIDGPSEAEILRGGATGEDLLDWFRTGHAALAETLAAADPAVEYATFMAAPSASVASTSRTPAPPSTAGCSAWSRPTRLTVLRAW